MVNRRGRDEREGEGASRQACTWSPASRRSLTRSLARRKIRRAAVERTGTSGMSGGRGTGTRDGRRRGAGASGPDRPGAGLGWACAVEEEA